MFKKTIENTSPKRQRVNESQSAHSLAFFEVALFDNQGDQQGENTGDYHNPTRQRGIVVEKRGNVYPSLTFRVVMAANAQLQNSRFGLVREPNMALSSYTSQSNHRRNLQEL